jgi:hypothetical protein
VATLEIALESAHRNDESIRIPSMSAQNVSQLAADVVATADVSDNALFEFEGIKIGDSCLNNESVTNPSLLAQIMSRTTGDAVTTAVSSHATVSSIDNEETLGQEELEAFEFEMESGDVGDQYQNYEAVHLSEEGGGGGSSSQKISAVTECNQVQQTREMTTATAYSIPQARAIHDVPVLSDKNEMGIIRNDSATSIVAGSAATFIVPVKSDPAATHEPIKSDPNNISSTNQSMNDMESNDGYWDWSRSEEASFAHGKGQCAPNKAGGGNMERDESGVDKPLSSFDLCVSGNGNATAVSVRKQLHSIAKFLEESPIAFDLLGEIPPPMLQGTNAAARELLTNLAEGHAADIHHVEGGKSSFTLPPPVSALSSISVVVKQGSQILSVDCQADGGLSSSMKSFAPGALPDDFLLSSPGAIPLAPEMRARVVKIFAELQLSPSNQLQSLMRWTKLNAIKFAGPSTQTTVDDRSEVAAEGALQHSSARLGDFLLDVEKAVQLIQIRESHLHTWTRHRQFFEAQKLRNPRASRSERLEKAEQNTQATTEKCKVLLTKLLHDFEEDLLFKDVPYLKTIELDFRSK